MADSSSNLPLLKSMESSSPCFEVMTSIRSDAILKFTPSNPNSRFMERPSQFYMISYHFDRMLAAANEFRWSKAANSFASENGIARLESSLKQHLHNRYGNADYPCPLKIRVFLDHLGNLDITSMPAAPSSLRNLFPLELSHLLPIDSQTWHIFVSPNSIAPSQYTTHKTTNRRIYDDVRAATCSAGAWGLFSEVLLVNTEHNVMEGSITTPYFYRRGRWVTPPAADGGNVGTTRRWALEKGLCVEESIAVNSLEPGERIWLSNGVRGWFWGHLETLGLREPSNLPDVTTAI